MLFLIQWCTFGIKSAVLQGEGNSQAFIVSLKKTEWRWGGGENVFFDNSIV